MIEDNVKLQQRSYNTKAMALCHGFLIWQGRRDSNTQLTVLETVALPLNYSPSVRL